ncbi:MAG: hypothetical protein HC924_15970 [Synechococcaceae cyanobacterium SM2_3_2]|nr:hypothetical protein [Synechococcaceae cyanobacterium SM2_3_2]
MASNAVDLFPEVGSPVVADLLLVGDRLLVEGKGLFLKPSQLLMNY